MIINPIIPIIPMAVISVLLLIPRRKGVVHYITQVLIVLLIFAINLRPMRVTTEAKTVELDAKVLLVVDDTISMLAEDSEREGHLTRLDDIKEDCKYIVDQLQGASFSVLKVDNDVRRMVPFSKDPGLALQCIDSFYGQSEIYATGSDINMIYEPMEEVLKENEGSCVLVFIMTDGEITNKDLYEGNLISFAPLKDYVYGGAVLGYGTQEGGRMKSVNLYADEGDTEAEYLQTYDDDYFLVEAISKIDEKNLKALGNDLDIEYKNIRQRSDLDEILKQARNDIEGAGTVFSEKITEGYEDFYYWFAIPLLLLLIFDFVSLKKDGWLFK